uniref:T9SS type A sorting domain-containing protein n=1 Tax=Flavobacterium sp. TaxID=239 RepID=UPI00404A2086
KLSTLTYFQIDNDINQSYVIFEGTSAATPIVAACAVVLQSYYYSLYNTYMSPIAMRNLLVATGVAQGAGGSIGPMPNMQTAMLFLQNEYLLSEKSHENYQFVVYPNPVEQEIKFAANGFAIENAVLEIVNSLGQVVYKDFFDMDKVIDVSSFTTGIYFLQISNSTFIYNQKIYKK